MFDFISDLVVWLGEQIFAGLRFLLSGLLNQAEPAWEWLKDIVGQVFHELWTGLVSLVPSEWADVLNNVDWRGVEGYLGDVSWILPVVPILVILSLTFTVCATIRVLRWVKSCIPTVSGA